MTLEVKVDDAEDSGDDCYLPGFSLDESRPVRRMVAQATLRFSVASCRRIQVSAVDLRT